MAGSIHAVSSAAKTFGTWVDSQDLPCLLHQSPTLPVGCACPALSPSLPGLQSIPTDQQRKCCLLLLLLLLQTPLLQSFQSPG
jgi:hypothetical protein